MNNIILFDGICNFCDKSVQFIIKRDPIGIFKFASLQSDIGEQLVNMYHIPENSDSLLLIENNTYFSKSTAALRICRHLKGFWKMFYFLLLIPKPIRDFFYDILAKNRYKWFGKKNRCMLPRPNTRERFL